MTDNPAAITPEQREALTDWIAPNNDRAWDVLEKIQADAYAAGGKEALVEALHPEFGTEWREPDGVIWKAHQDGLAAGRAARARDVADALDEALSLLDSARCSLIDPGLVRSWAQRRRRLRDRAAVLADTTTEAEP